MKLGYINTVTIHQFKFQRRGGNFILLLALIINSMRHNIKRVKIRWESNLELLT